jgi:hypothetical protein
MTTSQMYSHDNEMLANEIMKHFGFLVKEFNFIKLREYQYVREIHNDFVGKLIVVKQIYEGSFSIEILKPRFDIKELTEGKKRTIDYDYNDFERYDLTNLDLKRAVYNSIPGGNLPDKDLLYYSKLLDENSEILQGDLTKLKWKYRLLKRLKLK